MSSNGPRRQFPAFERPHEAVRPAPATRAVKHSLLSRRRHRARHRIRRRRL